MVNSVGPIFEHCLEYIVSPVITRDLFIKIFFLCFRLLYSTLHNPIETRSQLHQYLEFLATKIH